MKNQVKIMEKQILIYLNHELPNVCIAFPCATASRYLVYKHMHT